MQDKADLFGGKFLLNTLMHAERNGIKIKRPFLNSSGTAFLILLNQFFIAESMRGNVPSSLFAVLFVFRIVTLKVIYL